VVSTPFLSSDVRGQQQGADVICGLDSTTLEWKFIPKDMPFSEWSCHFNLSNRLQDLWAALDGWRKNKVKIRRDVVLIMGEDEEDLLNLATAATFLIQTHPRRLEVDFWKSFVNVDIDFIGGLKDEWWGGRKLEF
jgi:hypothetical protein